MGYNELISHLRKEGEEKIRQLWREREKEADQARSDALKRADMIKSRHTEEQSRTAEEKAEKVIADALRRSKQIRLSGEKELQDRLYDLAISLLGEMRKDDYESLFSSLVSEVPDARWTEVRVNPDDSSLAQKYFPEASVINDSSVSGGFAVLMNEGRIEMINTFEKRLEKSWEDITPLLMDDIYKEVE